MNTKTLATAFFIGLSLMASAFGADLKTFDQAQFDKAQKDGKTVVLNLHANWCAVCKRQQGNLEEVLKDAAFKNVAAFIADYDDSEELQKKYNAPDTSTVIVFKSLTEKARSVWMVKPDELRALITKGL